MYAEESNVMMECADNLMYNNKGRLFSSNTREGTSKFVFGRL